jgi:thiol-disulfide isomerase/thioredoxin
MRHWTGSLLAALLVAMPLIAADKDADDKGNDRTAQFKELQKDFQKSVEGVIKEFQTAAPEKRQEIISKLSKEYSPRVIKFVKADPKDKLSLDALVWGMMQVPEVDPKVYELLGDNWAKDAKIKSICQVLTSQSREGTTKLLEKVLDENEDKDAKGLACFALAKAAADKVDKGDKKAVPEAEKLFERVSKDFGDVKIGRDDTLGDQAKGALFEIRNLQVGKKAPNVESENLDGKKVQLKDYKGKVVVLDIWATWCPPCKAMIPHEREMVKKLKDKPFALISISADAKKEDLKKFLDSTEMPWTHWWNGQTGGILKDWNVKFFPTIYVLDSEGVIRYKHIRGKQLEDAVEKLLAEAKEKK